MKIRKRYINKIILLATAWLVLFISISGNIHLPGFYNNNVKFFHHEIIVGNNQSTTSCQIYKSSAENWFSLKLVKQKFGIPSKNIYDPDNHLDIPEIRKSLNPLRNFQQVKIITPYSVSVIKSLYLEKRALLI